MGRKILLFTLLLMPCAAAFSQPQLDTAFLNTARANTIGFYHKAIGGQSALYNGRKYQAPEHTLEQHPFFSSPDWIMGSVNYDGETFDDIPLMYDLYNQVVVTEHRPSGHPTQLVSEKLQQFSLAGHTFAIIENESVGNSLPRSGFYDVLYPGETKVIAERRKLLREDVTATSIERTFDEKNRYYIFTNGVFFPVRSKASVLKVLGDKKQLLKKYLKQRRMPFSKNRELLLRTLAEYYDTLK